MLAGTLEPHREVGTHDDTAFEWRHPHVRSDDEAKGTRVCDDAGTALGAWAS